MFTQQKKMPTLDTVLSECPLGDNLSKVKLQFDEQIKSNFISKRKFVVVCGPCSADDPSSMHEYLSRLSEIKSKYSHLLIVARIYTTKPHSNGQGYQGTCFHLNVDERVDFSQGIIRARKMMIDCLKLGLPVADELLYPELYPYFADLVSYWFVGARSSEDMLHRAFVSGVDTCCGVKNGTDGDIIKTVDSVYAISNPCVFPFGGFQTATSGCKYAHVVLRGGKLMEDFIPNLDPCCTHLAKDRTKELGLNDFVMVDLSHANSGKEAIKQIENAKIAIANRDVNGVMVESYLHEGVSKDLYGVSKTDDCLCFDDTAEVLQILEQGFLQR